MRRFYEHVVIRQIRHRWEGGVTEDPRVLLTRCGLRFVLGDPDRPTIHEPARQECERCGKTT